MCSVHFQGLLNTKHRCYFHWCQSRSLVCAHASPEARAILRTLSVCHFATKLKVGPAAHSEASNTECKVSLSLSLRIGDVCHAGLSSVTCLPTPEMDCGANHITNSQVILSLSLSISLFPVALICSAIRAAGDPRSISERAVAGAPVNVRGLQRLL